jgi:hypothetical protein
MKILKYNILMLLLFVGLTACEVDNYEFPKETFTGKLIDKQTKELFQTAVGGAGFRLCLMEYSWRENPEPLYIYGKQDGTFNNSKIFKGDYGITPDGAFVPLEEELIKIQGKVEKTFEVEPLLRVEWIGEPVVNANGTVTVQVVVTRGTDHTDFQQALQEVWLFVNETSYVFAGSHSGTYSTRLSGAQMGTLGATLTITSGQPSGPGLTQNYFPTYSRKYFLRVGARTNITIRGASNIYNYSTIKEITTPAR